MVEDEQIIRDFLQHAETFVEQPHPAFGGLPVCPFARTARLENRIEFLVLGTPGEGEEALFAAVEKYAREEDRDVLLVLYRDRDISCEALYRYIAAVNQRLAPLDLEAFGGHPQDNFQVQGVYTRRAPWPNFQILKRSLARRASRSLWHTGYYQNWTPEQLKQNGLPRDD